MNEKLSCLFTPLRIYHILIHIDSAVFKKAHIFGLMAVAGVQVFPYYANNAYLLSRLAAPALAEEEGP